MKFKEGLREGYIYTECSMRLWKEICPVEWTRLLP